MKTIMKLEDVTTGAPLTDCLSGTQAVAFSVLSDTDAGYRWIQGERVKFPYLTLSRQDKGVVIRYVMKVSGYSRQPRTRLIRPYRKAGTLKRRQRTVAGFTQQSTPADMRLLAAMDERHDTPCGAAVKKRCERAATVFGQTEYTARASISVSPLYNLRKFPLPPATASPRQDPA